MRKSRFTEEQIAMALRQGETGTPVAEIVRKLGISEQTYYTWRKKYGGLGVSELRELKSDPGGEPSTEGPGGGPLPGQDDLAGSASKKMVSPAQRRAGVQWAREAYRLPERRACRALDVSRSTVRYRSARPPREPLRARLRKARNTLNKSVPGTLDLRGGSSRAERDDRGGGRWSR